MRKRFAYFLIVALLAVLLHAAIVPAKAALTFDGTDDFSSLTSGAGVLDVSVRSISYWVFVPSNIASAQIAFVTGTNAAVVLDSVQLGAQATSGWRPQYIHRWGNSATWRYATDVSINAWHHVIIVYDRTNINNDPIFYLDGSLVTTTDVVTPTGSITTGQDQYRFGGNFAGASDVNATIAEFAMWNRALNADEAMGLGNPNDAYAPTFYPNGLIFYTPFLRNDGTTTRELRNGLNGTISGNPTVSTHPRIKYPFHSTTELRYLRRRPNGFGNLSLAA